VIQEMAYAAPALSGLLHPRQHHPLGLPPASPSYCDRISGEVSRLHSHLSASRRTHTLRRALSPPRSTPAFRYATSKKPPRMPTRERPCATTAPESPSTARRLHRRRLPRRRRPL